MSSENYEKGRGAQFNPKNPFDHETDAPETYDDVNQDFEQSETKTTFTETHPKTIINRVDSPDIGLNWSINPYQGCEHGCVYCYARNTHPYWGFSAGLDFESRILIKREAPSLLRKKLSSKHWKAEAIMLSGNTDCYQPVERKLGITREMLEILWEFRHPVGIITKNSLITRDIDILEKMAKQNLVKVSVSINGLDEKMRTLLEPRTASFRRRLDTIERLAEKGIPVNAMVAPIIPGLNDHEIMNVVKAVAEAGALSAKHIVVRLNGDVRPIFEDWLHKNFPDRAGKVIRKIESMHGGKTNDSRFGTRMRGEGNYAQVIRDQMHLAVNKYMPGRKMPPYNASLYEQYRDRQLSLF